MVWCTEDDWGQCKRSSDPFHRRLLPTFWSLMWTSGWSWVDPCSLIQHLVERLKGFHEKTSNVTSWIWSVFNCATHFIYMLNSFCQNNFSCWCWQFIICRSLNVITETLFLATLHKEFGTSATESVHTTAVTWNVPLITAERGTISFRSRSKFSGSQRAWCLCRTRWEGPRCYRDKCHRRKTNQTWAVKHLLTTCWVSL